MAEISQDIVVAMQGAMSQLTSAVSSVNAVLSSILTYKADKTVVDTKAPIDKPAFTGGIKIGGLQTSAEGLTVGALWVDTTANNVIKIVV